MTSLINIRNLTVYSLTFVLCLFICAPFSTFAATGLTIQPVKISETLAPGQTVSGNILLSNSSDQDVQVSLKTEDFIPTAGAETIQFVGRSTGVTSVRDWVSVDKGVLSFIFKKGQAIQIPYTITAPANAEPGSHFGVMFFKAVNAADASSQIKVGTQVGVLVFVTVPGNYKMTGEIKDFKAPQFVQGKTVPFTLNFANTGTVHFEPKGSIVITSMFGSKVGEVPIEGEVVLPTGQKNMSFPWTVNGLLLGRYSAVATVFDGSGKALTSETIHFYAFPIWYIASFLALLLVLFFLIKIFKSKIKISINMK